MLGTAKLRESSCFPPKIRRRITFCHEKASQWVFWCVSTAISYGKIQLIKYNSIDRCRVKFDQSTLSSIDRVLQNFLIFQAIPHEFCHSSLINLQNIKTQKLTKASENNKAKGLTYANMAS